MKTFIGKDSQSTGALLLNRTFVGGASALPYAHNSVAVDLKATILSCVKAHNSTEVDLGYTPSLPSSRI